MGDMYIEKWSCHLEYEQTGNPRHADQWRSREPQGDPVAQPSRRKRDPRAAGRNLNLLSGSVEHDAKLHLERPCVGSEGIFRTLDSRVDAVTLDGHGDSNAALLEPLASRSRREQHEGPLCPEQVGDRHRAQLRAVEAIRRKRDGNAEDRAPDTVLAEDGPERPGLAQQAQFGPPAGYAVGPQPEVPLDATDVRRRQKRQVRSAVAVQEVEDVVPPGLGAGAE